MENHKPLILVSYFKTKTWFVILLKSHANFFIIYFNIINNSKKIVKKQKNILKCWSLITIFFFQNGYMNLPWPAPPIQV